MKRRCDYTEADKLSISRTWRRIAVQTAALFLIGIVAVEALAVALVLDMAGNDARRQLTQALDDPDAITNPPLDISVYVQRGNEIRNSPGAAPGPVDRRAWLAAASGAIAETQVRIGSRSYLVHTGRQGATLTQVALDLTDQEGDRRRVLMSLVAAGGVGLLLAGGVGALIGRRAIAPLGQALTRQQRFIADASHELRTPLTQLHTRAQLLEREVRSAADPVRMRDDVDELVRGTRQMGELVEELLVAAAIRAEPRRFGPVDLHAVARQVAAAEQSRASARMVRMSVTAEGDGCHVVRGSDPALRRVLMSLVDNALSHTAAGGQVGIRLRTDPSGRTVEAAIHDNGEGFEPGEAERLFERFYRGGHGDPRRFGLGLALVREVVTGHGGTITATGAPGVGACFTLRLPVWTTSGGDAPARS